MRAMCAGIVGRRHGGAMHDLVERYLRVMWVEHARARDAGAAAEAQRLRSLLVEHYLERGTVHRVAKASARKLPREVQLDELVSAGSVGLIAAVDCFDIRRGVT